MSENIIEACCLDTDNMWTLLYNITAPLVEPRLQDYIRERMNGLNPCFTIRLELHNKLKEVFKDEDGRYMGFI
jgi:hypothetical protein